MNNLKGLLVGLALGLGLIGRAAAAGDADPGEPFIKAARMAAEFIKNPAAPGSVVAAVPGAPVLISPWLPEGSFKGSSPMLKGPNVLAFLVKKDPSDPNAYYAILAEYDRVPYIPGPERIEIARWVPRIYAYRVEAAGGLRYAVKPLRVSAGGGIEVDAGGPLAGELTLAKKGTLDGAKLTRYEKGSPSAAETITFKGKVSSTWEGYVPGDFFGSKDSTGGDYFHKQVNTTLSKDQVADFFQKDVKGKFDISEKAPGMFVFRAKAPAAADDKGKEKIEPMIGVFVDIVNWKPFFTTDELLLINPDDAKDVGFYYERH